jgi:hypothetical protein
MIPVSQRLRLPSDPMRRAIYQAMCGMRVMMPATVLSFDPGGPAAGPGSTPKGPTVSVQPAISEVILQNAVPTITPLPILDDVPVQFARAGGFSITLPIAVGDECMLVFADMCIDTWFQNGAAGGPQKQPDGVKFRHDIGDAIAIFGLSSGPRALASYSTDSLQIRSDDETTVIDVAPGAVTITAAATVIQASSAGTDVQPLVTASWLTWFTAHILPFLVTKGYIGPAEPVDSMTVALEAN